MTTETNDPRLANYLKAVEHAAKLRLLEKQLPGRIAEAIEAVERAEDELGIAPAARLVQRRKPSARQAAGGRGGGRPQDPDSITGRVHAALPATVEAIAFAVNEDEGRVKKILSNLRTQGRARRDDTTEPATWFAVEAEAA